MVFVVISKEIAGEHGPEMVFPEGTGFVFSHIVSMGLPVGDEGAEVKQLKGCEEGRDNPENYDGRHAELKFKKVEHNGHGDYLPYGGVPYHEHEPPNPEIA